MTDTPRTDSLIPEMDEIEVNAQEYVNLSRNLERELAAMTAIAENFKNRFVESSREKVAAEDRIATLERERNILAARVQVFTDCEAAASEDAIRYRTEVERLRESVEVYRTKKQAMENENARLLVLLREAVEVIEEFNSDVYQESPRISQRIRAALGEE